MYVITGGGRGIGKALALALAARGKSVLIIGRHAATLTEVANSSDLIEYWVADVSTPQGRESIVHRLSSMPTIDGLIHNAGIIEPIQELQKIQESDWRQLFSTNLEAPLFLSQLLLHKLEQGRVLHIGSGAAYFPMVGCTAYCVSKAALSMLTRCWQLECQSPRFASVMPGIIDTDMTVLLRFSEHMASEKQNFFRQLKQDNHMISTDTVALFLTWLLLDVDPSEYSSKEWDIYDISHQALWLPLNNGKVQNITLPSTDTENER